MTEFQTSPVLLCNDCGHTLASSTPVTISDELEPAKVKAALSAVEADMTRYGKELTDLEKTLRKIKQEYSKLVKHKTKLESILSSVSRIPSEIWMEILSLCCRYEEKEDTQGSFRQSSAMRLSSVCRSWRNMIQSAPALWASFAVDLRHDRITKMKLIKRHLTYSRDTPLDIAIRFPFWYDDGSCDGCISHSNIQLDEDRDPNQIPWKCSIHLLCYLISHSATRWSRLWITAFANIEWLWLLQTLEQVGPLQKLEWLRYDLNNNQVTRNDYTTPFMNTPALRHLYLRSYIGTALPISAWSQLETAVLDNVDGIAALSVLRNCCHLYHIELSSVASIPEPLSPPIIVASVTSLKIEGNDDSGSVRLLQSITLPNLQSCSIGNSKWPTTYGSMSELVPFFERSGAHINALSFWVSQIDDPEYLEQIFRQTPAIESLVLINDDIPESLLAILSNSPSSSPLLPRLKKISLACYDSRLEALIRMIESRRLANPINQVARLASVTLSLADTSSSWEPIELVVYGIPRRKDPLPSWFSEQVEKLCDDGLDITILPSDDYLDYKHV